MTTKTVTRRIPLFSNDTDDKGRRTDRRDFVSEGAVSFGRDGTVILAQMGFALSSELHSVKFAGCEANRELPYGVLVITTPTGEEWHYSYCQFDKNWYRLVEMDAPHSLLQFASFAMVQSCKEAGVLIGVPFACVLIAVAVLKRLLLLCMVCFAAGFFAMLSFIGVNVVYSHLGNDAVLEMTRVVWLLESTLVGLVALADCAGSRGGWFWKYLAPIVFLYLLICFGSWLFPSWEQFVQALTLFTRIALPTS